MIEIIALFVVLCLLAAWYFSPIGHSMQSFFKPAVSGSEFFVSNSEAKKTVKEEGFSFLNHLKKEIEADLFPRPTCSVLQRHYDALVAAEVENRLALMAE